MEEMKPTLPGDEDVEPTFATRLAGLILPWVMTLFLFGMRQWVWVFGRRRGEEAGSDGLIAVRRMLGLRPQLALDPMRALSTRAVGKLRSRMASGIRVGFPRSRSPSEALLGSGASLTAPPAGDVARYLRSWACADALAQFDGATQRAIWEAGEVRGLWEALASPPRWGSYRFAAAGSSPAAQSRQRVLMYFHGGGYLAGSAYDYGHYLLTEWRQHAFDDCDVVVVAYRRTPEAPLPVPVVDCVAAYEALLATGVSPKRVAFSGDSAGGGMVVQVLAHLVRTGKPLPACAVAICPWLDYRAPTGPVPTAGECLDPLLQPASLRFGVKAAVVHDALGPALSPLLAEPTVLARFPPVLTLAASLDPLYSQDCEFHATLSRLGVRAVEFADLPGGFHVSQLVFAAYFPEASVHMQLVHDFLQKHLSSKI